MPKCYPQLRDRAWLERAYRDWTCAEIASRVGCSTAGVKNALDRHGIQTRPSGRSRIQSLGDDAWLTEAYRTQSTRQIARTLGCSQPAVWKRVVALGLDRHPNKRRIDAPKSGYWKAKRPDGSITGVHRIIIETEIGRRLEDYECVHHIDGNSLNNERSNLVLLAKRQHDRLHAREFVARNRQRGAMSHRHQCIACGARFVGGNRAKRCKDCR